MRIAKNIIKFLLDTNSALYLIFICLMGKTIFIGHRNWGFGHQILELKHANDLIELNNIKSKCYILCYGFKKNYSNYCFFKRMVGDKIEPIEFKLMIMLDFIYEILLKYYKKSIDIGSGTERNYRIALKNNKVYEYEEASREKLAFKFKIAIENKYQLFNSDDIKNYKNQLQSYGVKSTDWYVCLHYRNSPWSRNRNSNALDYRKAIEYIYEIGGNVIAIGEGDIKSLDIPYFQLNKSNQDLMVYLLQNQRLLISNNSGPTCLSFIFNHPVITTNNTVWDLFNWSYKDSHLPKMILDKRNNCLINATTYLDLRKNGSISIGSIASDFEYINNSPDEILMAVKNKIMELESGVYIDSYSQSAWRNKIKNSPSTEYSHSNIDRSYYEKYINIFES